MEKGTALLNVYVGAGFPIGGNFLTVSWRGHKNLKNLKNLKKKNEKFMSFRKDLVFVSLKIYRFFCRTVYFPISIT